MISKVSVLPHMFSPRSYQKELFQKFFIEQYRYILTVEHRRAGKDKECLNILIGAAMQKVGSYFYLFPKVNQVRRVIWEGIDKNHFRYLNHIPEVLIKHKNNQNMLIELINGSQIYFGGTDDYNKWMGTNPIGIVFSEFSLQSDKVWPYFQPILAENGGWAIFNFTFRGYNHAYDLYSQNLDNPEWFVRKLTVDDTEREPGVPVVSPEVIDSLRKSGLSEGMIQQEFYCSPDSALPGAYYEEEITNAYLQRRIGVVPVDNSLPLYTFWDIGLDTTAIWFMQPCGHELRMVNYYGNSNLGMRHYCEYRSDYLTEHRINRVEDFAPHDINNREYTSGKTRKNTALEYGIYFRDVPNIPRQDGIQAAKEIFRRVWFDQEECKDGLNGVSRYHRIYDSDRKEYLSEPYHDFSSHPADAFRYFAVAWNDLFSTSERLTEEFVYDDFIV